MQNPVRSVIVHNSVFQEAGEGGGGFTLLQVPFLVFLVHFCVLVNLALLFYPISEFILHFFRNISYVLKTL